MRVSLGGATMAIVAMQLVACHEHETDRRFAVRAAPGGRWASAALEVRYRPPEGDPLSRSGATLARVTHTFSVVPAVAQPSAPAIVFTADALFDQTPTYERFETRRKGR